MAFSTDMAIQKFFSQTLFNLYAKVVSPGTMENNDVSSANKLTVVTISFNWS